VFSHIFLGVKDFERAFAFYEPVMEAIGAPLRFVEADRPWAGWQSEPGPRPLFLIGTPYDRLAHEAGNGQMVAFLAHDCATVDRVYEVAMASGATSEGAPGPRPEYHSNYYGAYFRDLEGNKLCIACHAPPV
jgi:lactoylglutathione lyase